MKALVTGGTGFLGSHVVRQLAEKHRPRSVRVLARGPSALTEQLGVELAEGDLARESENGGATGTLAAAFAGCDQVFHLAGFVSRDPRDGQRMMRVHIDGTRRVLEAAKAARIKRVVIASTSGTIAVSREPQPIADETAPYPTEIVGDFPYYLSKIYQEKLSLELGAKLGIEVVIVNPSLLLGPGDERQSSTGDVRKFLRRQIPVIPSGGVSFVDARDAAAATITAMESGRPGERYLLGGPNWTFAEFLGRLERSSKVRGPMLKMPKKLTGPATRFLEHAYRALPFFKGSEPPFDSISAEMSQLFWWCDSSKAARELGFVTRDPAETLDDTIRDLRERMF